MLIINADDWGRCEADTDAAHLCCQKSRVTSVTGMVFMRDSERAAEIARKEEIAVGLHLNLTESYTGPDLSQANIESHNRISRFLKGSKYNFLLFHPLLISDFRRVYAAQVAEFRRLYGSEPSHIDGHQHMHLCANVVLDKSLLKGVRVRRSFSFQPGEKSWANRMVRCFIDRRITRRARSTEYFLDLADCLRKNSVDRLVRLARMANVELMTHPVRAAESNWLLSDACKGALEQVQIGSYRSI